MEQRSKIICSYLKMNNKDDEFKISIISGGFIIEKNNQEIFEYSMWSYEEFYIKFSMINKTKVFKNNKILYLHKSKLTYNYESKEKKIFYHSIELNKKLYIQYNINKTFITFLGYKNKWVLINIKCFNRLIYKFNATYKFFISLKYTNYKILIPNKYELLYYSRYFHVYS